MRNKIYRISAILIGGLAASLIALTMPVAAQRLCENNDNPAATIEPCFGSIGTVITVKPGRIPASGRLIFKRRVAPGTPAEIIVQIAPNSTATIPPQLCTMGNGRWEVWFAPSGGQRPSKIGAFTTAGCINGTSSGLDKGKNNQNNTTPANDVIVLPPITMNIDNEVYAKTRSTGQSAIKGISSSAPAVATGTEWGTNEVKIYGKREGVAVITFVDDNTGTTYRVTVTVVKGKGKQPNGDGNIKPAPQAVIDPCLVGEWEAVAVGGPVRGGTGFLLTIKADGTQTADYSSMQILTMQDLSYQYGGAAEGVLVTGNGVAKNVSINQTGVTLALGNLDGMQPSKLSETMGPGALGVNRNGNRYTCTDKTLSFSTEDYRGKAFMEITMQRRSKTSKETSSSSSQSQTPTGTRTYSGLGSGGKIDRRLVGTWRSEPSSGAAAGQTAEFYKAGGVLFIVKPDGTAAFDYNNTQTGADIYGAAGSTSVAKGRTTAKIVTQANPAMITLSDGRYASEIIITNRDENGESRANRVDEFFPFGAQGVGYEISAGSLTMNFGNVTLRFARVAD